MHVKVSFVNGVGILTLDHPPHNIITTEMFRSLEQGLDMFTATDRVRAIVIDAAGPNFSVGADIKMLSALSRGSFAEAAEFFYWLLSLGRKIERSPKPVIAQVQGRCYGAGTELALCCDHILVAPNAEFALPEIKHGIFPGWGGTQRLPRRIGYETGAEHILSGRSISAIRADELILARLVTPDQAKDFMAEVIAIPGEHLRPDHLGLLDILPLEESFIARTASGRSCTSANAAARALYIGNRMPMQFGLLEELQYFLPCMLSPDGREGLAAFGEKRQPKFSSVYQ